MYEVYEFADCQHGFVKQKSIVTNATAHIEAKHILNIDLKNFFDTINFGRVRGMFLGEPFNFNNEVATILARIVCNDNKLPQGAPTSPAIANMICYILDNNLSKYCNRHGCIYTRYADDITISSKRYIFPKQIAKRDRLNNVVLGDKIIRIIEEESGFLINKEKVKYARKMQRQEVTGIVINEKINTKRIYVKNLRALLHNCRINGIEKEAKKYFKKNNYSDKIAIYKYREIIEGKLNFLKMVRGEYDKTFLKYAKEYNDIIGEEIFDVDSIKEIREYIEERTGVIESQDGVSSQGTIQFVEDYGAITSGHIYFNKDCMTEEAYKNIKENKYEFPIKFEDVSIFNLYTINNTKRVLPLPKIEKNNIDNDFIKINISNSKCFKINCDEVKIGEQVIVAGYGEFVSFDKSSLTIENAEVISERKINGINAKCVNIPIFHGMSGGPVLNKKREAIGIIYCGGDYNDGINNAFIPFSEILHLL